MTKSNTMVEDIARAVCFYYNISLTDLSGLSRKAHLARARGIYFYACRMLTTASTTDAAILIDRDHSTAVHHHKKMSYGMTREERNDYEEIRKSILDIPGNLQLESFNNLGRYFMIIKDKEFAYGF